MHAEQSTRLVPLQQLPIEVLRKIFDELFYINEAYRWTTPRLRYIEWMTVCKLWHPLMTELLYRSVQLEDLGRLRLFSAAIKEQKRRALSIESFQFRDSIPNRMSSAAFTRIPFAHLRSMKLVNVHIHKIALRFSVSALTVTSLECRNVSFACKESLKRFIKCFTNLRTLNLEGVGADQANFCEMLRIVGSKLDHFSLLANVQDLEAIFALIPNVKRLNIRIHSKPAWTLLSPYSIPQACREISLQSAHLPFVMEMIASIAEPKFMPELKGFPRIFWASHRGERPTILQLVMITALKEQARVALSERGIRWTAENAGLTILEGTSS